MGQRPFLRVLTTSRRLLLGTGRFWREKSASVLPILALLAACMVGVAALAVDLSRVYIVSLQSQRVADMADIAAAKTSNPVVNGKVSDMATATAQNVATINGITDAVTLSYVTVSGKTGLKATVTQNLPLIFGSRLAKVSTGGSSVVQLTSVTAGPCLTSLWSYVGTILVTGQASVVGKYCQVVADDFLSVVAWGPHVSVASVTVGIPQWLEDLQYILFGADLTPFPPTNFTYNQKATDPVGGTPAVTALESHIAAMASWPFGRTSPVRPKVTAGSTDVTASGTVPNGKYRNLTLSGATVTFPGSGAADPTCANPTTFSGTANFSGTNTLTFNSGCYVFKGDVGTGSGTTNFNAVPGANVVYVFAASLYANGNSSMIFNNTDGVSTSLANITYYFNGGTITVFRGSAMTFASGPFYLWGGNLANSGTFTAGNGPFTIYGGTIYNYDNSVMTWGNGPFYFHGGSLNLNSGSTTVFGTGNMDFYGGTVNLNGKSVTFGNGGSATGAGSVSVLGGTINYNAGTLNAIGETFVVSGLFPVLWQGSGTINASAPTGPASTSASTGYQNILLAVLSNFDFQYWKLGGVDTLSGIIYVPNRGVSIAFDTTAMPPVNGCLQFVGGGIIIDGNANLNLFPCSATSALESRVLIQ